MTALICGSMAYDTVMVFQGRFREHILPDRIHMLNVSFLVPSMRRRLPGTISPRNAAADRTVLIRGH